MTLNLASVYSPLALSLCIGVYCAYAMRRIKAAPKLEEGLQATIKLVSAQVTELQSSYERIEQELGRKERNLSQANERAQRSVDQLKLLITSLHNLPGYQGTSEAE